MVTTIGLIRHGVTEWNLLGKAQGSADISLNDVGRSQAERIGNRLSRGKIWDLIVTSDLPRAVETAKIIGSKINLSVSQSEKRIREIDCGQIEGTTEKERENRWGRNWRKLDLGMEKNESVAERGIEFLEELVLTYSGKR